MIKGLDGVRPDDVVFLAIDNLVGPLALRWILRQRICSRVFVLCHNNLENLTRRYGALKRLLWKKTLQNTSVEPVVLAPFLARAGEA